MSPAPGRKAAVLGSPVAHFAPRNFTWPPTARSASTTGPTTGSSAPLEELPSLVGGFGPEWVGVSVTMPGVRRAAVRRRADQACRTGRIGQHPGAHRRRLESRQHRRRRRHRGAGIADGPPCRRCGFRRHCAGRRRRPGRTRRDRTDGGREEPAKSARLIDLGEQLGMSTVLRDFTAPDLPTTVAAADVLPGHHPGRCGRAVRRGVRPDPGAAGCHLRAVAHTLGSGGDGSRRGSDQRAADAVTPGVQPGRTIHRQARPRTRMAAALVSLAGMGALGWAGCLAVIGWAAALCVKDIRELRLPNALTLGGAVAILWSR